MPTAVQPDIEDAAVVFLRSYAPLVALGAIVGTTLPTGPTWVANPTWPVVVVTLQGGPVDAHGWVAHPRFQIDSWADTQKKARDAAFTTVAGWFDLAGVHSGVTIAVPDDAILSGPRWLPDSSVPTARPRYITDAYLTVHP